MVFQIVSIVVPIVLLLVVREVMRRLGLDWRQHLWLLITACVVFFISWWLPSPLIDGQDTSFVTHFIGGGVFSGLFWVYLKRTLNWSSRWFWEGISLFALVSMLGVMNELFELVLWKLGGMPEGIGDTSWDLLANTLGAGVFFIVYVVAKWVVRHGRRD